MNTALKHDFLSVEDYLAGEERSELRHEYLGGMVYAMAGGTDAHNTIAGTIYSELRSHLRGGPCRVFIADVKVHLFIAERNVFYYPDVMVACDPRDTDPYSKRHPKVVVEVLSETTENTDRREKLWNYTQSESLQEYLLVAQDKREVTVFRRSNGWEPEVLQGPQQTLEIGSLGLKLPLSTIYEGVDLRA